MQGLSVCGLLVGCSALAASALLSSCAGRSASSLDAAVGDAPSEDAPNIPVAPLTWVQPGPGESWALGSLHQLVFLAEAALVNHVVDLDYSLDGGATWAPYAADLVLLADYEGFFTMNFEVPSDVGAVQFRLVDEAEPTVEFLSESPTLAASQADDGYEWALAINPAPFAERDGLGGVALNGRIWLLGGWNPYPERADLFTNDDANDVWSSADGVTWERDTLHAPWEQRHAVGYEVFDGSMWVIGGDPLNLEYQTDVWRSDDGLSWERTTANAPWGRRVLHITQTFNGRLWVMGGQTLPPYLHETVTTFYNDVWSSADGTTWAREVEHAAWEPRGMAYGATVFQGQMWLLGGGTYDTPDFPERTLYNDVWRTSDGVHWERVLTHAPWQPRSYHTQIVWDDKLWVLQGHAAGLGNANDVWYSSDGSNWYELPNTPWAGRHAAASVVHDGRLWMIAGNNLESDVWSLSDTTP